MIDYTAFQQLSPTTLADVLSRDRVMDTGIHPLWSDMPRVAGPAYTVRCAPGDNLMLHAAIYRAAPGSVIVIETGGDMDYAVAGGNVCAVAQKHGITAFVIDGVIRDLAEARANRFPVFARGVIPIPGGKEIIQPLKQPITCGGVAVSPGDVVVADEEGIVVVPAVRADDVLKDAQRRALKDAAQTLEQWEAQHRERIEAILRDKGFRD